MWFERIIPILQVEETEAQVQSHMAIKLAHIPGAAELIQFSLNNFLKKISEFFQTLKQLWRSRR